MLHSSTNNNVARLRNNQIFRIRTATDISHPDFKRADSDFPETLKRVTGAFGSVPLLGRVVLANRFLIVSLNLKLPIFFALLRVLGASLHGKPRGEEAALAITMRIGMRFTISSAISHLRYGHHA